MTRPKPRGTGVIERQTLRAYDYGVYGGILAFHTTDGFPYDITLDIFREKVEEGLDISLQPLDLMYEMCALGLYDMGEEVGQRFYGDEWPEVYTKMKYWAATHWTLSKGENKHPDEIWSDMLLSMREELRSSLKKFKQIKESNG